jgi:hypothetical protein
MNLVARSARAYNRWFCDKILAEEPPIKSMLLLPTNYPPAARRVVEEFGDRKGVIGFMVTSTRYKPVYDKSLYGNICGAGGAWPAVGLSRGLQLERPNA